VIRAEVDCVIQNELGLHLRAAASFVKLADRFQSDVTLYHDSNQANGKSIIALVTLAASRGTSVRIVAEGPDAGDAISALSNLIKEGFGESS
jgi:phosphocarrier protein